MEILANQRRYFVVGIDKGLFGYQSFSRQKRYRENGYVKTDVISRALALSFGATRRPELKGRRLRSA